MPRRARPDDADLPTPRRYLNGPDLLVWCETCRHRAFADMGSLVAAGSGDTPLVQLRWRCSVCGSTAVQAKVTGVGPSATWDGNY